MLPCYSKSIRKRYFGMQWLAKQEGSRFEISFEQAIPYFLKDGYPRLCAYCGRAPDFGKVWGLDRIDSSLGHIPGNLVPCCSSHYESPQLSCQGSKSKFSLLSWMERSMSRANGGPVPFRVVEQRLEKIYTLAKELASIEAENKEITLCLTPIPNTILPTVSALPRTSKSPAPISPTVPVAD